MIERCMMPLCAPHAQWSRSLHDRPRELTISTARAEPDIAMVEVRDTGTGIDPGHLDRLFKSFYTTKAEGMGMGLAISRTIVEAHGGALETVPNEPHGAVFRFTVPTRENAQASPEALRS
jgi:two-component system sensor kinase FixL